ncbi:hypothetical protein NN561_002732 [Cricetulus griseus]
MLLPLRNRSTAQPERVYWNPAGQRAFLSLERGTGRVRTPPPARPSCWPLRPPTTGSPASLGLYPKWRCARGWRGRAAPEIAPAGTMRLRPLPLVVVPGLLQLVSARPAVLSMCRDAFRREIIFCKGLGSRVAPELG